MHAALLPILIFYCQNAFASVKNHKTCVLAKPEVYVNEKALVVQHPFSLRDVTLMRWKMLAEMTLGNSVFFLRRSKSQAILALWTLIASEVPKSRVTCMSYANSNTQLEEGGYRNLTRSLEGKTDAVFLRKLSELARYFSEGPVD